MATPPLPSPPADHRSMSFSSQRRRSSLGKLLNLVAPSTKAEIQIDFDSSEHRRDAAYTYGDTVAGHATIFVPTPIAFDEIEVALVGQTECVIDRMGATPYTQAMHATHVFLKLVQPVSSALLVSINDIPANESRVVPFNFVVPGHALPTICRHRVESPAVREAHLQLPPSFGEGAIVPAESDGSSGSKYDDMCPSALKISYGIRIRLMKRNPSNDAHDDQPQMKTLMEELRRIRISPAIPEQPPVNVEAHESEYCLRKVKSVKKGMFKGTSTGQLILETVQPPPLRIPAPNTSDTSGPCAISTVATVTLRYDPSDASSQPPKLGNLSSKLKVLTFYHSYALENWPSQAEMTSDYRRQIAIDTVSLSSRTMASVNWQRCEPGSDNTDASPELFRSTTTTATRIPAASVERDPTFPYYLAHLLVPIALPNSKHFVPTFHNCLVSRLYILELAQDFKGTGSNTVSQHGTLRVPIQITSEPREGAPGEPEEFMYGEPDDDGDNDDELEDYFTPRSIGPPPPAFSTTQDAGSGTAAGANGSASAAGEQLPPEYSASSALQTAGQNLSLSRTARALMVWEGAREEGRVGVQSVATNLL